MTLGWTVALLAAGLILSLIGAAAPCDYRPMRVESHKIAKMAHELSTQERMYENMVETQHLARQVSSMVRNALDAFARMDADAAPFLSEQGLHLPPPPPKGRESYIGFDASPPRSMLQLCAWLFAIVSLSAPNPKR